LNLPLTRCARPRTANTYRRRGKYGEDYFTLASTYFQGRPPKSVNLHWRRFRVADIPLDDHDKFDVWLRERWYEKDALMEKYISTGRFPPCEFGKKEYIETEVRTKYPWEVIQVFSVLGVVGLMYKIMISIWQKLLLKIGLR
jgi:lysocardiolipin and lysophospholipid acyltransferase